MSNVSFTSETRVGDVVREFAQTARVFESHGIDFCCGGKRSLAEACNGKGVSADALIQELAQAASVQSSHRTDYDQWSPTRLAQHIVTQHHGYIRSYLPDILKFTQRVADVHGDRFAYLGEIAQTARRLGDELTSHMMKEERILFPFIQAMDEAQQSGGQMPLAMFGSVCNPIRMMEHEHDEAGALLKRLRELSSDYDPPREACTTWSVSWQMLKAFEEDLHLHIHLENNILFPKAAELERHLSDPNDPQLSCGCCAVPPPSATTVSSAS